MAEKVMFNVVSSVTRLVPFIFWQVASLSVLIIIMCMLVFYGQRNVDKKKLCSALCGALILLVVVGVEYYERAQIWLKVDSEAMNVYIGPGKKYPRLPALKLHDEVRVIKRQGAWLQIEDNGRRGWVENEQSSELVISDKV